MPHHKWLFLAACLICFNGCGDSSPPTPEQLVHAGHYDEAIEICTQRLRAEPRDAESYLYRGRAYHCRNDQGDVDRAIDDFTHAIALAPAESEAYYSRALAYRDAGNTEASAADEKQARRNDPRLNEVYSQLPETFPQPAVLEKKPEPPAEQESTTEGSDASKELNLRERGVQGLGLSGLSSRSRLRPDPSSDEQKDNDQRNVRPQPVPSASLAPTRKELLDAMREGEELPATVPTPRDSQQRESGKPAGRSRGTIGRWDPQFDGPTQYPQPFSTPSYSITNPPPLVRSPFPQRPPRPTGYVEEPSALPSTGPRQLYNNPYSAPAVRLPGAYHDDFNP